MFRSGDPVQCMPVTWRQIWRVAGRESGSPELLGSPPTSPEVSRTPPEVFGDFPGSSLTVELNSNSRGSPEVSRTSLEVFRRLPRKFPDFPGFEPLSLGSLTPSPDSQKLSLSYNTEDHPPPVRKQNKKTNDVQKKARATLCLSTSLLPTFAS